MKNTRPRVGRSTAKTDQQSQILDRLFDYFSKPKGEKPTSDSDVQVSFYRSALSALPHNFHDNEYNGVNIIMLLQEVESNATKVPIYSTFKQASDLLEQHKDQLPPKSETFDPDKPLKGITLDAQVVKYLETYKKDGELISKSVFDKETRGMSFTQMRENGYQKRKGLKPYKVFPIEKIKHLLPEQFIEERDYFARQEELENKKMSPEMEDVEFVEKAQLIIDAMGVPVVEKNQDKAFYSPKNDCITIPPRNKFISDKAFFAVILHELSHSTGHPSRLNRKQNNASNSKAYFSEELIAETSTMFICLDEGLETFNAHASYLEGYASQFKDQKKALLSICKQAKEAQNYISRKVMKHKLDLSMQSPYKVPEKLDFELKLADKHTDALNDYIVKSANNHSPLIQLKNQKIIGYNESKDGIEVFTPDKKVALTGVSSAIVQRELDNLKLLQSIILDVSVDNNDETTPTKNRLKSSRLSM
ncbi:zincin-like metallopeptidase domain-containing protein [Psychromonas ossibalaenae]|uniref:zincin-like metallopeptidase domain-containing protein n=1 Tax=Psychromonas ossibalaenae TaxID=444922 RepID=UPI00035CC396|nr:zincin-like metallopeptidase domain-containing protein [Psychromonas ossibalaenae]